MRIAFIMRSSARTNGGGDLVQAKSTLAELQKLGFHPSIVFADQEIKSTDYELLHFFNLIRPADILKYLAIDLPKVLSPIYVDYSEFDRQRKGFMQSFTAKLFGKHHTEYLKTLIRQLKKQEQIKSNSYLFKGQKATMQKVLKEVDYLLPNTHSEMKRIKEELSPKNAWKVIPNGVDDAIFNYKEQPKQGAICAARFEGLKNQHLLIEVFNNLQIPLKLIGKVSDNHLAYYKTCLKEANNNIEFLTHCSQKELAEHFRKSKVHVLASWFETTGLSSLEAAACGAIPVVSNKGDVHEYFDGIAEFCEVEDTKSIEEAVKRAMLRTDHRQVSEHILSHYTWKKAAKQTAEVYNSLVR